MMLKFKASVSTANDSSDDGSNSVATVRMMKPMLRNWDLMTMIWMMN
jgi:hypothetical protein